MPDGRGITLSSGKTIASQQLRVTEMEDRLVDMPECWQWHHARVVERGKKIASQQRRVTAKCVEWTASGRDAHRVVVDERRLADHHLVPAAAEITHQHISSVRRSIRRSDVGV